MNEKLLDYLGIRELNPVQKMALKTGYLENKLNLVVASPTGSGKTLIAELAITKSRKAVYTCPLKAIATEKYREFQVFEKLGKRVAVSIGDLDSNDPWLANYDIIITTNEKLDSLMRHRAPWLGKVDLLIVDEIHLIDSDRGPTLESVIMRFKYLFPKTQIIALSATIPNSDELAEWLDAVVIKSQWRPVKLVKGVYLDGIIETEEGTEEIETKSRDDLKNLVSHYLAQGKSILVFTPTRKSAEATAESLASVSRKFIDQKTCKSLAERVVNVLESPTKQCERLAKCIEGGSAFHHAGLVSEQRKIVEDSFRSGHIKVICSTPTLAMGVNLPADVVIMKSLIRYSNNAIIKIPRREFFQCAGRAGRPGLSSKGLALLMARSEDEKDILWNEYIMGKPEEINSRLAREPILRSQVLASISMRLTPTYEKLSSLFMHSFLAHQYGDIDYIMGKIKLIVKELESWGFVKTGEFLEATQLGSRVSELYIDPYSAHKILEAMKSRDPGEFGWLYIITDTEEMRPWLGIRKREESEIWLEVNDLEEELGMEPVKASFEDYHFLEKAKTALMLKDWINEATEEGILEKYNVAPGILRAYISNADWMAYSASELAKLAGLGRKASYLKGFRRRIIYGVKEELLPLIELKGIGRIKARRLYSLGIKKPKDIKSFKDKELIKKAIGEKTMKRIIGDSSD